MTIKIVVTAQFDSWALKNDVTDSALSAAAQEIESGLVDARLGGFLLKKRLPAPGRGKRGGYRTIVGYRQADRLIFVHGFAKNEMDNITTREKEALRKLCDVYMLADDTTLSAMMKQKLLREIRFNEPDT